MGSAHAVAAQSVIDMHAAESWCSARNAVLHYKSIVARGG